MSCFGNRLSGILNEEHLSQMSCSVAIFISQLETDGFEVEGKDIKEESADLMLGHKLIKPNLLSMKFVKVGKKLWIHSILLDESKKETSDLAPVEFLIEKYCSPEKIELLKASTHPLKENDVSKLFGANQTEIRDSIQSIRSNIQASISRKVIPCFDDYLNQMYHSSSSSDKEKASCDVCGGSFAESSPQSDFEKTHSSATPSSSSTSMALPKPISPETPQSSSATPSSVGSAEDDKIDPKDFSVINPFRHFPPSTQRLIVPPRIGDPRGIRFGDDDRLPGMIGPELGRGGGGNLLGPNHPMFFGGDDSTRFGSDYKDESRPAPGSIPPGARYDPPYPEFGRHGLGSNPRNLHPDLEHFPGGGSRDFFM
ncbi:uncharacterized protein MONOS_10073 [Monocercomonoides exilis]|uniref:uncharacterized protein n=1 Tax=Monocercomonoides exilis TaxID=2049356 RepID=UPI00355AB988|nr:hypothetical protein MONOS_10073 [Monocercomonoides exilis]|eukprot:MONOS_10073.1-p1 / transcript=MONOS_10073.1 / gene=MONOS_10073 / organism=Monocercomonoides_exilis_PA203 / gene_product=unspecified product / transcript_product=unspecified product / location=Mono_scaffold00442:11049-12727(+) / protein_length=368 / sequence_SO=supercontig / SO=protein_coding / is_pseudo=false